MIEPFDIETDRQLSLGLHKVVCAWHEKLFGFEKVIREAKPGHETDALSHGICPDCLAIVREQKDAA